MNARRAGATVLLVASGAALAVLCVRGIYVRYNADDYWTASIVARLGFWKSQSFWYERWSGRFAYTFLIGIVEAIGPRIVPALVALAMASWVAATLALLRRLRIDYPAALAMAFVYAAAEGAPDVPQSILWQTGLLTYVVPIAGITAWLATTVDRERVRWYDAVLPFVLAGFSESNTIAQIIALFGVLCLGTAFKAAASRRTPKIFATAFIATIAALIVVGVAPGNAVRMSLYPRHSLAWITSETLSGAASFFASEVTQSGIALLLIFVASSVMWGRASARPAAAAAVVAIVATIAIYAASAITLAVGPPARTLIVPHFLVVAALAVAGAAVRVPDRIAVPLLILLAIGGPLVAAVQRARAIPEAAAFARAWDSLDAQLRFNPGREVVVTGVPGSAGTLSFITHDRDRWSNRCISDYYSLTGIAAAPPGPLAGPKLLEDLPVYATEGPRRHDDNHVLRLRFASD
jgi:hypothetical protein